MNTLVILCLFGVVACIQAKATPAPPTEKSTVVPDERCGGGGGFGGGGWGGGGGRGGFNNGGFNNGGFNNGGFFPPPNGGANAGQVTGVQALSDGSYLLYCGIQVCGRTNPTAAPIG